MNKSDVVCLLQLQPQNPEEALIRLAPHDVGLDGFVDGQRSRALPILSLSDHRYLHQFVERRRAPVEIAVLVGSQLGGSFSRACLIESDEFVRIVADHVGIGDFDDLPEVFDVLLAEGFQTAVARVEVDLVAFSYLKGLFG